MKRIKNMLHIVWFKRDLRITDHAPLVNAARQGAILPLYILEPDLWKQPDLSHRQYMFLSESVYELKMMLQEKLIIKIGDAVSILKALHEKYHNITLWSHQETWNMWSYQRDKAVKKYCRMHDITWHEMPQFGVKRILKNRDDWADIWHDIMLDHMIPTPETMILQNEETEIMPPPETLGLADDKCYMRQIGGRRRGLRALKTFLHDRGEGYTKEMSSPVTAFTACSRLSPHIAFGTVSLREIFQTSLLRQKQIYDMPPAMRGKWDSALRSFLGRLRWHCHFIQKLEDDPDLEFKNMHYGYDGIRENDFNEVYFTAWKTGHTGYPMIDAAMRALIAHGWINFRMRAMLVSFASYHLWLDWRRTAPYLASLFTDYEPGIHYMQFQMQSGTTGMNAIRVYNPTKQGKDQDPEGHFIRQWVPELKHIEGDLIFTPWEDPALIGDYPLPIIDEKSARKAASDKIYAVRKGEDHKQESKRVFQKHGSRKKRTKPKQIRKTKNKNDNQPELPL